LFGVLGLIVAVILLASQMGGPKSVETRVAATSVEQIVETVPQPASDLAPSPSREKFCRTINATEVGFQGSSPLAASKFWRRRFRVTRAL
jgi:hypothetical protein